MERSSEGILTERRERKPDNSPTPPLKRPWLRWDIKNRADTVAAVLLAVGIVLGGGALFFRTGDELGGVPPSFIVFGPIVTVLPFVALVAMYANRERRGFARVLLALSAAAFAGAAVGFTGRAPVWQLLLFYWVPALISIAVAMMLAARQKAARDVEARLTGRTGP